MQTGDVKSSEGRIRTYSQTYSEAGLAQSRLWPRGTLCITIAANIAETGILQFDACFPDSIVGFVANAREADVEFVEYALRNMRRRIQHEATGSVQDNINLATLDSLRLAIPELGEQRRIAAILAVLDDKIELNRQMNETLEEMARALFKSWFVDFDPVRAKMEGRKPFGMDAETAALFPDSFEESELGPIPKGWRVHQVGSLESEKVLEINDGYRAKRSELAEVGVPFARAGNINNGFQFAGAERLGQRGVELAKRKRSQAGDVVFTSKGTVGRFALVGDTTPSFVYSPQLCFWRSLDKARLPSQYVFQWMQSRAFLNQVAAVKGQTDMAEYVSLRDQRRMRMLMPPSDLQRGYCEIAGPLMDSVEHNCAESATLAELRDTLLPKLLSGELRIPEAEELVEAS